ncbi:MAG: histidine phosphotransferase family protein [Pseudomonadota bacterium]
MPSYHEPNPLELASLMISKTCHDIISPVGAAASAMEMWETSKDEATTQVAQTLMGRSSAQAVAKLTFVRIAYGAFGDVGGDVDLGEAKTAAEQYIVDDKTALDWQLDRAIVPKPVAKLALGLLALAKDSIPRGGSMSIKGADLTTAARFTVRAEAAKVIIPQGAEDALSLRFSDGVHARNVHLYHLIKMAEAANVGIVPELGDGSIVFETRPTAQG